VLADRIRGTDGGHRLVGDVERDLGGVAQQPGLAVAAVDAALDPNDGGNMGVPVRSGQFAGGIKDGDGTAFVTVAALVVAVG
jgi:hypothetical protein